MEHISFKCWAYGDQPHSPCSGTCDGHGTGQFCDEPCTHWCHPPVPARRSAARGLTRWLSWYLWPFRGLSRRSWMAILAGSATNTTIFLLLVLLTGLAWETVLTAAIVADFVVWFLLLMLLPRKK